MSTLYNFAIGSDVVGVEFSPTFDAYSRVTIEIDDDTEVTVGSDIGRELRLVCPWGTEQMAQDILDSLSGYQYQPYSAQGALIDPSAEIGDGVTIRGIMGGIYAQELNFSPLMESNTSATQDEEIDHEYPYVPPQDRKIRHLRDEMEAEFTIQSGLISAKVSRIGGEQSSFGWELDNSSWTLYANNQEILKATSGGLEVRGKVTALSGYIGNGSSGFTIGSTSIYNGMSSFDSTANGVYVGTNGIALGGGAFKVSASGQLSATSGTFTGAVYASSIKSDSQNGYGGSFHGGGLSSGSVSKSRTASSVQSTLTQVGTNQSDIAAIRNLFAQKLTCNNLVAAYAECTSLKAKSSFAFGSYGGSWQTIKDGNGNNVRVLTGH